MHGAKPAAVEKRWDAQAWAAAHVQSCAAPAFVANGDGTIVVANSAAQPMVRSGALPHSLSKVIVEARLKNSMQMVQASFRDPSDGAPSCFDLALLPLPSGHVLAVGRDVSPAHDTAVDAVIAAMWAQTEPRRMLAAAADALASALEADVVSIEARASGLRVRGGGMALSIAHKVEAVTTFQGAPNGDIKVARETSFGPFDAAATHVLGAVAPHIGLALAFVEALEASDASDCDEATGLLNRRAFLREANRRYAAAARAGRELTLFLFDCDDREDVAGAPGASMSAEALVAVGQTLAARCGADDLAGALDDDEFAFVADRADDPLEALEAMRLALAATGRKFSAGVSITAGSAVGAADGDETLEDLIARAECALQTAKRDGRDCSALVEKAPR